MSLAPLLRPPRRAASARSGERYDAVVVGAGFGGLGAAMGLAERGARVRLYETLNYPGGCASTFRREGRWYESGATLFSGFGEGQLFQRWIERHRIPLTLDWLDPLVVLRTGELELVMTRDRRAVERQLAALPGAPREGIASFFAEQRRTADALWSLLARPELLPPFGARGLLEHLRRAPRSLPALRWAGRPLARVLRAHGVEHFQPLRVYADALCQITLQCSASEAEAPFALAALDYMHQGTAHVRGGIGELAWGLTRAFERLGGEARFGERVRALRREGDEWLVESRHGTVRARQVIANLLPQDLKRLVGLERHRGLDALAARVEEGWGACMLYLAARAPEGASDAPIHLELVDDAARPLLEGNHVFLSIGGAQDHEGELRSLTASTHVPMSKLRALNEDERAAYVQRIQDAMRATIARRAPEWLAGVERELPASPRTFARFTGRHLGHVGGVPRRAGLANYLRVLPLEPLPGLHLVGDTAFPGQSTLATALGGLRSSSAIRCRDKFSTTRP